MIGIGIFFVRSEDAELEGDVFTPLFSACPERKFGRSSDIMATFLIAPVIWWILPYDSAKSGRGLKLALHTGLAGMRIRGGVFIQSNRCGIAHPARRGVRGIANR